MGGVGEWVGGWVNEESDDLCAWERKREGGKKRQREGRVRSGGRRGAVCDDLD